MDEGLARARSVERPMIEVRDRAGLGPGRVEPLARRLAGLGTLERVIAWAAAQEPPRRIGDIVTQDEFTHDVLVPIDPPLWLAFDVT
jgi:hypothetical protein